jgi:hypothetical protein
MKNITITLDQAKIALDCVDLSIMYVQDTDIDYLDAAIFNLQRLELKTRLRRAIKIAEEA